MTRRSSVVFNNSGTATVNGGTLYLGSSTANASSGSFKVAAGAKLQFNGSGAQTLTGSMTDTGNVVFSYPTVSYSSGTYSVTNTTVSNGSGAFGPSTSFTAPNLTVSGVTLNLSTGNPINFNSLTLSSGTLTGLDPLTITSMTWSGGTLSGSSTATVNGTLTWSGGSLDTRTFNNTGATTFNGSYPYVYFYNGATFNNQAGASFTDDLAGGTYAYFAGNRWNVRHDAPGGRGKGVDRFQCVAACVR